LFENKLILVLKFIKGRVANHTTSDVLSEERRVLKKKGGGGVNRLARLAPYKPGRGFTVFVKGVHKKLGVLINTL
jgi:hypothetical protein